MVCAAGPVALPRHQPRARREASLKANAASNNAAIVRSTLVQIGGLYAVSQVCLRAGCCAHPPSLTPVACSPAQACLLSIFVPQKCPAIIGCPADGCLTSPWFTYLSNEPDAHLCSLKGEPPRRRSALPVAHAPAQRTSTG